MKSDTYPIAMPRDLIKQVRAVAKETGLSMADTVRQSVRLGLPTLRANLCAGQIVKRVKPLTDEEADRLYKAPNAEFDALEAHMTRHALHPLPEGD